MSARLLRLGTCTCEVTARGDILAAMDDYTSPYTSNEGAHVDFRMSLHCSPRDVASVRRNLTSVQPAAARRSHPEQQYHVWNDGSKQILLPLDDRNHVLSRQDSNIEVTADTPLIAATIGVRVLRQLIMRGAEAHGGRSVHAGAVRLGGKAILVGGPSGAGKTTVLTHLTERHGGDPLANDRTVIVPSAQERWSVVGVPLAWRFTPEGVHDSPTLAAAIQHTTPRRGGTLVDGKVELTPLEITRALRRSAVATAPLHHVVLLTRSDTRPEPADAAVLRAHLDFGDADFFAEDWLNLRPQITPAPREPSEPDLWTALHASIAVHTLSWTHPSELPDLAAVIAAGAVT